MTHSATSKGSVHPNKETHLSDDTERTGIRLFQGNRNETRSADGSQAGLARVLSAGRCWWKVLPQAGLERGLPLLMGERHGVRLQAVLNANSTLFNSMLRSLRHYIVGT